MAPGWDVSPSQSYHQHQSFHCYPFKYLGGGKETLEEILLPRITELALV